jgi:hypothetical protein
VALSGRQYCWGLNEGAYAISASISSATPLLATPVGLSSPVVERVVSDRVSFSGVIEGGAWTPSQPYAGRVAGMRRARRVVGSNNYTCVVLYDGTLHCWDYGQPVRRFE